MDLKEIRNFYNLSQEELAKLIDMEQGTLSKIERGILDLRLSDYGKLVKALELSQDFRNDLLEHYIENGKPKRKERK